MEKEDADVAHTSSPDQSLWLDWSFGPGRELSAVMSSQAGDLMGCTRWVEFGGGLGLSSAPMHQDKDGQRSDHARLTPVSA